MELAWWPSVACTISLERTMQRRTFLQMAGAATAAAKTPDGLPTYKTVSSYKPADNPMPGHHPGHVVAVHSERCIDTNTGKADAPAVQAMVKEGMVALTGRGDSRDAWSSFFSPADVVGIKVNCSGAPNIMSSPVVVAEIVTNLMAVGVLPA